MRKNIWKKLKSQQGASFLLALLFFILCSVVTSSILMASVSNAGRKNSNETEHQKYLWLSSALHLICDDIVQSSYQGNYTYTETTMQDGGITRALIQNQGTYRRIPERTTDGNLKEMLLTDFDSIFAEEIKNAAVDQHETVQSTHRKHEFTITSDTEFPINDTKQVEVILEVKDTYIITLKATLDDYTMKAELTPITKTEILPDVLIPGTYDTLEMKWNVDWIRSE